MTVRWLDGNQCVDILNPLIEKRNRGTPEKPAWALLNSATAFAVAAFEEEFCLGFLVMQLFPFLGPAWVEPIARNGEVFKALGDSMVNVMAQMQARGAMVVADNPATERMCRMKGMRKIEAPVYVSDGAVG
jgi:hypothetical protein